MENQERTKQVWFYGSVPGVGTAKFERDKFLALPFAPGVALEPQEIKESGGGWYRWCVVVNEPSSAPPTPGQIDRATFTDAVEALVDAQRTLTGVIRDNNLAYAPKAKARVDQARARLDALVEPFLSAEGE